jgi:hypothetical protein
MTWRFYRLAAFRAVRALPCGNLAGVDHCVSFMQRSLWLGLLSLGVLRLGFLRLGFLRLGGDLCTPERA